MKKKLMALLLTLTMIVTLIPAMSLTAFAESEGDTSANLGERLTLVLDMGQTTYQVGESIKYHVFAKDSNGDPVSLTRGKDYEVEYSAGGEYQTLYNDYLPAGDYTLIARGLGHISRWTNPQGLSDAVGFTVRRQVKSTITIYAPSLWINTGDVIPDITYRYEITGLQPGDDVHNVLTTLPALRYASTPNSKKAGTYTITFSNYPQIKYYYRDKYDVAYVEGSLVVRENKSDNEKAFETYRAEKASDCDRLYVANDTAEIKNIANNAKANILNTPFNKNKSLQQNCDVVYTIYNNAANKIHNLRDAADEANDKAQIKATKPEIDDIDPIKKGAKIYITKDTYHKDDGEDIETYQIARATKKNGKYKRVKTVTNTNSYKRTITAKVKKLKSGRVYYFKVRGVVTLSNGKKVYTKWSKPDYVIAY